MVKPWDTFGGAVGVAGLTTIAAARADSLMAATTAQAAALDGLHTTFAVAGAVCLVGPVIASTMLRRTGALRSRPDGDVGVE